MIGDILDFIANSVFVGSMPGNGKRELKFIALAAAGAIFVVVILYAIAS